MPILTHIARANDGTLLVASTEHATDGHDGLEAYKRRAKNTLLREVGDAPHGSKFSIESPPYVFHQLIEDNVCYMTFCDKSYPTRLAFGYLGELRTEFVAYLQKQYNDDWRRQVETVSHPYAFIKFDKILERKRKEYSDPSSRQNVSKLNESLEDIHNIMKKNIQDVLDRGERLEHVQKASENLVDKSKQFHWGAKKLNMQALWNKYWPRVAFVLIILLVIWYKFLW